MTLIEVLVVMAVIGLLASLFLPAIERARREAKMTVCLNNLRQINLAVQYFLQDQKYYPGSLGG